jgi:conjugal transfer pilus assembly protein TraU
MGIPRPGISVSFWEPTRIIESVIDPFCFPSLGFELDNPLGGKGELRGTAQGQSGKDATSMYAAQAHLIIFPVWGLLGLLTDLPCLEQQWFDVAYFTELDPLWQSDFRSLILNPEALVFGNPLLQMACMADAVAAATGVPNNVLFWCMGQWGSAYPLTGKLSTSNMVMGAAGTAARLIYKLNRELLMCDHNAGNGCGCVRTPIWQKANYRLQIVRPRPNTSSTIRIGEPSPLWESNQQSMASGDENFAFVLFRKNSCCVTFF